MSVDFTEPTGVARAQSAGGPLGQATLTTLRTVSLYRAQPWRWRVHDHVAELWVDRDREPAEEPRLVTLAGGLALDQARVALAAVGHQPEVTRLPDPARPDLLCVLSASRPHRPTPTDIRAYQAMLQPARRPPAARPTTPVAPDRFAALIATPPAGIHLDLLPDHQPHASYAVLSTDTDEPAAWLAAGELLSAVLIRSGYRGVRVRPLTGAPEQPLSRQLLTAQALAGRPHPLLALRLADAGLAHP